MNRVYISGRLTNELQLKQLRNYLWVVTDAHEYYKKKEPHVTLVPGFNVKDKHVQDVRDVVDNYRFVNRKIKVNSLSVYENIHKPYVVQLDVEYNFDNEIDELIDQLREYAKTDIDRPASPHITLYKTEGWWETIPREKRKRLQEEIMCNVGIRDSELSRIEINTAI
jgi:2'-5' RNA ligase